MREPPRSREGAAEHAELSVRWREPLSRHMPLRTGGPCEAFAVAHSVEALHHLRTWCREHEVRLTLLGAGTRTVIRDGGLAHVVARLGTGFVGFVEQPDGSLHVGAGVPVPALVARLGRALPPALRQVPGSLGASLCLDVGWDALVQEVWILRRGRSVATPLDEVRGGRALVLGARLAAGQPIRGDDAEGPVTAGAWYEPTGDEGVRDVFRSVRLPMVRLRDVAIPESAPEMMINLGAGTAEDLGLLARSALDRVKKVRGDVIAPRMRWLGCSAP